MDVQQLLKLRDELNETLASLRSRLAITQSQIVETEKALKDTTINISKLLDSAGGSGLIAAGATVSGEGAMVTNGEDIISILGSVEKPNPKVPVVSLETRIISKAHEKRLRCLDFSPDGTSFLMSSHDGLVKLWNIDMMDSTCLKSVKSPDYWPEDLTYQPVGQTCIAVYTKTDIEHPIVIISLVEDKLEFVPTEANIGGIRRVKFMPTSEPFFVTAGVNKSVIGWKLEDSYTPTVLHHKDHTNEITGVCGIMNQNQVISVGLDKKMISYDYVAKQMVSIKLLEDQCFGIYANPVDHNLLCAHVKNSWRQLLFCDRRQPNPSFHLGWTQDTSDLQSSLTGASWSPNGYLISTGSSDPLIHLFDVRINRRGPSQTIRNAHSKRVFRAVFHPHRPLLVSLSDDFSLGMHTMKYLS